MNTNISLNPKYFIIAVFVGMLVYIAYVLIFSKKKEDVAPADTPVEPSEPEFVAKPAVVLRKRIDGEYSGFSKHARYNIAYFVTFLVDGEELEVAVDSQTFENVYEGMASTLVMEGEEFFDFSDGEDVDDADLVELDSCDEE